MNGIKCISILAAVMVIAGSCRATDISAAGETVVEGNNEFALELYSKLREKEGNLFFSPYSISTALAMTYAGARGETEAQMAKALHFPTTPSGVGSNPNKIKSEKLVWSKEDFHSAFGEIISDLNKRGEKSSYELTVANALWGQKGYGFVKEFLELIKTNYGGGLNEVDFIKSSEAARQTINAWVEKATRDKIKELIQKGVLSSMTRLVLTNAIYFKGNWASQFEKDKTKDAVFTLINGKKIDAAMMNQMAEYNYMEGDNLQVLELPYVDNELSMIILLPKETDGLGRLEKELTAEKLSRWLGELRKRKVIVSVPKFKQTSQFGLVDVLSSMGMTDAFMPSAADFSGMNGRRDLFISAVIHKAFVEVNEEGTEAAAATGVVVGITSVGPRQIPVFRADHPFLFLIRDNHSGSILFIGRVMEPKAS